MPTQNKNDYQSIEKLASMGLYGFDTVYVLLCYSNAFDLAKIMFCLTFCLDAKSNKKIKAS